MDDDVREQGQPEPRSKTDQEIFDEQIARASGKFVVKLGGLGIVAALVMSTVALLVAAHRSNTTVTVSAAPTAGQTSGAKQLTGDALGQQIFVSGTPGGGVSCGSCHTMKSAGTSSTIGPNLDKELASDPVSPTRESIILPNKEIARGYQANVMPSNYATALTTRELDAVVNYVYHSTNTRLRSKAKSTP